MVEYKILAVAFSWAEIGRWHEGKNDLVKEARSFRDQHASGRK